MMKNGFQQSGPWAPPPSIPRMPAFSGPLILDSGPNFVPGQNMGSPPPNLIERLQFPFSEMNGKVRCEVRSFSSRFFDGNDIFAKVQS